MEQHAGRDGLAVRRAQAEARRNLLFGRNEALDRHLDGVRSSLIDAVLTGLLLIALVAVPASVSRSLGSEWLPLYSLHVATGVAVVALYLMRRRLSDRFKAAASISLFWVVGLAGLLVMGLAGSGLWWLAISSLLVSVLYSVRAGLLVMGLVLAAVVAVGTAFCLGALVEPRGASSLMRSPAAWVSAAVGATLMPLLVFRAFAAFNAATLQLLKQASEQRELIQELATHDELTGVPTFTLALDRLEQALRAIPRSGRKVGLLFIDLDKFKTINDSLGHEAGDAVLAAVARRLCLNLRSEDTVARIGGDEFVVILSGLGGPDEAVLVATKLQKALAEAVPYRDVSINVACSIGAAFAADGSQSAEQIIRAADAAMYEAKRSGSNQVRLAPGAMTMPDLPTAAKEPAPGLPG